MRQMGHQRRGLLLRVCREADRLAVHTGPNFKEALTDKEAFPFYSLTVCSI